MKHDIKIQEVDLPERLRRRCDDHIKGLNAIKAKIDSGKGEVYEDLAKLSDEVYETAATSLKVPGL